MREILLTSSVLILTVLLLRRIFRTAVSRRVQYALWALVLVRLLMPGSLPAVDFSVLSVSEPVQEQLEARLERREAPRPEVSKHPAETRPSASASAPAAEESAPEVRRAAIDLAGAAALIWKTGAAAMACWLVWSNLRFWQKLRRARVALDIPDCSRPVYLVEEGLRSPCLFGLLRPAIYLTPAAASPAALRHVLAHEETHARHLDPVWSLLRGVCLAVYWFDPLVWWAAAASWTDCELACDEGALARLGEQERIPYGKTLLVLVPVKKGPENPMLSATTMTAGKKRLKERVTRIAENRKCGVLALCALLVLVLAACAATFTGGTEAPKSDSPASAPGKASAAAPSVVGREPVLSVPLTGLEPYVPTVGNLPAEDSYGGFIKQETVSADTMGEVLVDKTLSDGTRIVCYWDPDAEYTKYWAIRDGDTLLRFYKEDSAYNRDYDVEEYSGLFGRDGFILYAPRGAAYFAIDYWYLDGDGKPQVLAECSNQVIRADWNGDGEDDLMWFYHDSPYLYFRRDGVLYNAGLLWLVQEAWPEVERLGYELPEDAGCIRISGYVDAPSQLPGEPVELLAMRDMYIQGDQINLYKDPAPAVTGNVADGIEAPEDVLEIARQIAWNSFQDWRKEGTGGVDDWFVSTLQQEEAPAVSRARSDLQIELYSYSYRLHAAFPGDVLRGRTLIGFEDGWMMGFNIDSQWLLFQVQDGQRELLDVNMVSGFELEDAAFTAEYAWALTRAGVLRPSELDRDVLYLDFCWRPERFLEDLAGQPSEEQDAALEKLTDYIHGTAPADYAALYPDAVEGLDPGHLSDAARALYERLPAGDEGPSGWVDSGENILGMVSPLLSGSVSIDLLDYGITPEMTSLEVEAHWSEMSIGALCAYYLHSDGAGAEGSSDELYRRFLASPEEVLVHLAAIGDQAAPSGSGLTAAEELCRAIASADVFWYDCAPEFADVMEQCRKTASDEISAVLNILQREHDDALSR